MVGSLTKRALIVLSFHAGPRYRFSLVSLKRVSTYHRIQGHFNLEKYFAPSRSRCSIRSDAFILYRNTAYLASATMSRLKTYYRVTKPPMPRFYAFIRRDYFPRFSKQHRCRPMKLLCSVGVEHAQWRFTVHITLLLRNTFVFQSTRIRVCRANFVTEIVNTRTTK